MRSHKRERVIEDTRKLIKDPRISEDIGILVIGEIIRKLTTMVYQDASGSCRRHIRENQVRVQALEARERQAIVGYEMKVPIMLKNRKSEKTFRVYC